jgi:hypothetical protein
MLEPGGGVAVAVKVCNTEVSHATISVPVGAAGRARMDRFTDVLVRLTQFVAELTVSAK